MEQLGSNKAHKKERHIKVLQFGEGKFLRAFVDYMIDVANESGDFDCGVLLEEGRTIKELGNSLYDYVLSVANGRKVKSEEEGYRDLAIFKRGVTL